VRLIGVLRPLKFTSRNTLPSMLEAEDFVAVNILTSG